MSLPAVTNARAFCMQGLLVNDAPGYGYHTCIVIRKEFLLAFKIHLDTKEKFEAEADGSDVAGTGVTRCVLPTTFA